MMPCAPRHRKRRNHVGWAIVMNVLYISVYTRIIWFHGTSGSSVYLLPVVPTI